MSEIENCESIQEDDSIDLTKEVEVKEIKSPMKKVRKNKKEKKELAAALAAAAVDAAASIVEIPISNEQNSTQVQSKSKSKKDKLNKAKMLSKQSTIDSMKSNEELIKDSNIKSTEDASVPTTPNTVADAQTSCPFAVAIENAKNKKPKKKKEAKDQQQKQELNQKDNKVKDESICIDDVSMLSSADASLASVKQSKDATGKGKGKKDKKSKNTNADKKEAEKDYSQFYFQNGGECTLVTEIAKARQHIKNSLERMDGIAAMASTPGKDVLDRISSLEKENSSLREIIESLRKTTIATQDRIKQLELKLQGINIGSGSSGHQAAPAPVKKEEDDDDGVDLFASESEDEDETAAQVREQRLAEYAAKKSKKPTLIAKSNVILDIKPWDDETDMKKMEENVRKIQLDGLLWGAAKLVPLAFGIHKLQISTVVEDEKVSIDLLTEEIEKLEEFVQSVDVAAFNKI